uniref:Uncharacterized protein n=1 Tax=Clastoptera arizonana TaxID=38151 RepID=A0A1B6E1B7_9HEMI
MFPRWLLLLFVVVVTMCTVHSLPVSSENNLELQETNVAIQPINDGNEVVREKRTIGVLRQLFPTLSQIIDRKIQAITRILFRLIGRLVLRGAGNGGGGGTNSDSSGGDDGRRISITLPTFPPSVDEDEDEDSTDSDVTPDSESTDDSSTTTTEPSDTDNTVSESKAVPVVARRRRQTPAEEEVEDDQVPEATGDNELSSSAEEDDADSAESADIPEDSRDKRLVNFGGGSGGSGGGSGNFLFDIIRLVAGSGTSQSEDVANNAPLDDGNATHAGRDDGYSAAVPGPLTRLFVIANRGIANLIQDLILRLAQTSERIVNFKARLITSII